MTTCSSSSGRAKSRSWIGRAAVAATVAAAVLTAPAGGLARAGADPNPLPRFLEGLQVGPAVEFRLVVLHGVWAPPPDPAEVPALVHGTPADALGVNPASHDGHASARVTNFGRDPVWALPGDVVRLADGDYVVRADTVLPGEVETAVPVFRVASASADEKPREEARWMGALPGPALLWTLLTSQKEKALVTTCAELAKETELATGRRSPVELRSAEKIAARVREYRSRLATIPKPPAAGKRELAGVAVVLDGAFAGFEVFADAARFASVWPSRLEGICVEAAVAELENDVLGTDLADPVDPDRYTGSVKDAILPLYGLAPAPRKVPGLGSVLPLEKDDDRGRAVVLETGAPQHVLWLRDPARRRTVASPEPTPLDPGVIDRKARPTEFEKRWRERRKGAGE